MNADAFRHLYDYHFATNRKIWDTCVVPLTQAQFVQPVDYSVGSICNHVVHLMNVDNGWFSDLRGVEAPDLRDFAKSADREKIRTQWDDVEQMMRGYLLSLTDDMLFTKPFSHSPDDVMYLWQVLIHVANHGTDHRAQMLMLCNQSGITTDAQDYFFYIIESK